MTISIIAAVSDNNVIGPDGDLPFTFEDMVRVKTAARSW